MFIIKNTRWLFMMVAISFAFTNQYVLANETATEESSASVGEIMLWNNDNWLSNSHPIPMSFYVNADGEIFGTTSDGIPFSQTNVLPEYQTKIQKFVIQDHFHFIVGGKEVYTLEEIASELTKLQKKMSNNESYY
jgi:cell division protein FtsW (lipid II flippase)